MSALDGQCAPFLLLTSIISSASLTLCIVSVFRPPLLARLVLLVLFTIVGLLGTFLPIHPRFHFKRWTVRAAGAWAGALGTVVSIGILSHVSGWESVWLRFVVKDSPSWGGAKEDGLIVGLIGFALVGILTDWILEKRFGPDPSQVCLLFSLF